MSLSDAFRTIESAHAEIRRLNYEINEWFASRFFTMRILENGRKRLWPCTEGYISRAYDLSDCDPEIPEFFYSEDDGSLHLVTVGKQERSSVSDDDEAGFVFAAADMVANGKVVGHVLYTDH